MQFSKLFQRHRHLQYFIIFNQMCNKWEMFVERGECSHFYISRIRYQNKDYFGKVNKFYFLHKHIYPSLSLDTPALIHMFVWVCVYVNAIQLINRAPHHSILNPPRNQYMWWNEKRWWVNILIELTLCELLIDPLLAKG